MWWTEISSLPEAVSSVAGKMSGSRRGCVQETLCSRHLKTNYRDGEDGEKGWRWLLKPWGRRKGI